MGNLAAVHELFTGSTQLTSGLFKSGYRELAYAHVTLPLLCLLRLFLLVSLLDTYAKKARTSLSGPSFSRTYGYASTDSCAGRLSMKELTENTARPAPGSP